MCRDGLRNYRQSFLPFPLMNGAFCTEEHRGDARERNTGRLFHEMFGVFNTGRGGYLPRSLDSDSYRIPDLPREKQIPYYQFELIGLDVEDA